jgi:hypothetical protein
MKDISDFGWLCILLIFVAISVSCWGIFGNETKAEDHLAKQIREISNTYPFNSKEKSKLISELIQKHNPTNTISKIEAE